MKIIPTIKNFFTFEKLIINTPKVNRVTIDKTPIIDTVEIGAKAVKNEIVDKEINERKNQIKECLYRALERENVPRNFVDKFFSGNAKQRYYRYVGKEELEKVLMGENVTSNRPCHEGYRTDVTSNPFYGEIPTIGKYRITFKEAENMDPFLPYKPNGSFSKSRMNYHNISRNEYYLYGGYNIDDIEKIEKYYGGDSFELIYSSK